jgi:hypothetical protein
MGKSMQEAKELLEEVRLPLRDRMADYDIKKYPEHVQRAYRKMVSEGSSRPMALMLATRSAPVMGNSDRAFCEYQHHQMTRDMDQDERTWITAAAHKAGIRTEGKTYMGQIGTYDDPLAWVSGREDAALALKKKGLSTDGVIKVKASKGRDKVAHQRFLAPDLVERKVDDILRSEPKTLEKVKKGKVKRAALRERVRGTYGPPETR